VSRFTPNFLFNGGRGNNKTFKRFNRKKGREKKKSLKKQGHLSGAITQHYAAICLEKRPENLQSIHQIYLIHQIHHIDRKNWRRKFNMYSSWRSLTQGSLIPVKATPRIFNSLGSDSILVKLKEGYILESLSQYGYTNPIRDWIRMDRFAANIRTYITYEVYTPMHALTDRNNISFWRTFINILSNIYYTFEFLNWS